MGISGQVPQGADDGGDHLIRREGFETGLEGKGTWGLTVLQ